MQPQLMNPLWAALRRRDRCLLIRPLSLNPDRPLGHLLTQRELGVLTSLSLLSLHDTRHGVLGTRTAGLKGSQRQKVNMYTIQNNNKPITLVTISAEPM